MLFLRWISKYLAHLTDFWKRGTSTHQAHEDTDELYDVSVGHGVESSKQGVEDGDTGRGDDGHFVREPDDNAEGTPLIIDIRSYLKEGNIISTCTTLSYIGNICFWGAQIV